MLENTKNHFYAKFSIETNRVEVFIEPRPSHFEQLGSFRALGLHYKPSKVVRLYTKTKSKLVRNKIYMDEQNLVKTQLEF